MWNTTNPDEARHRELTELRLRAFTTLFGDKPAAVFTHPELGGSADDHFFIDVFLFSQETPLGPIVAAVTNGMSDQRMIDGEDPERWSRRELIQYFRECSKGHARRLRDMAWLPLFDGFLLDAHHSIGWDMPAVEGTPWTNAFFVEPLVKSHREFVFEVEGDKSSLLWHVPISEQEREFKKEHGSDALLDKMDAVQLPWIFDENNRPSLLP